MTNANEILGQVKKKYGFVPNLFRELAKSPAVAEFYLFGGDVLSKTSFTERERQVAYLTISAVNECGYCLAAHGTVGEMSGLTRNQIEAISSGAQLDDQRLDSISNAVRLIAKKKGWLEPQDLSALDAQGIDRGKLYELVAFVGLKTVSNYINHIADTPVDAQFVGYEVKEKVQSQQEIACAC